MKKKIISLHRKYSPLYRTPHFTLYDICYLLILGALFIALMALAGVAIYYIVQLVNTFASLKLLLFIALSLLLTLLMGMKIDQFIDELWKD